MRIAIVMTTLLLFVAVFVILISTDWLFPDSFSNTTLDSKTTPEGTVVSYLSAINDNDIDEMALCFIPELRNGIYTWGAFGTGVLDAISIDNVQTRLESMSDNTAEVYTEFDIRFNWLDEVETEHISDTIALERISSWWFISATFSDEESAYNLVRDELQLATTAYLTNSSHGLPIVNESADGTLAICPFLGSDELLREVPDGCRVANCRDITGTGDCGGCADTNHYEWRLDDWGNVYSVCVDVVAGDCAVAGDDGYQGIWP
jgi:hypothetical protein